MAIIESTLQALTKRFKTKDNSTHERHVKSPAIEETVQHVYQEDIQPVQMREVREVHINHLTQPIFQENQKETQYDEVALPLDFKEVLHENTGVAAPVLGSYIQMEDKRESSYLEPIEQTVVTKHIVDIVQPIVRKHTSIPHHLTKIVPSFTRHVYYQEHHDIKELPAMSRSEWDLQINDHKHGSLSDSVTMQIDSTTSSSIK